MGSSLHFTSNVGGSHKSNDGEIIVSGIADAVAYHAEGRIEIIVDWKSDVEIDADRLTNGDLARRIGLHAKS